MFKSDVYKTCSLVMQLGISMMVPIFLLVIIAYYINKNFNIDFMLLAIIVGVLAGARNVIVIVSNYLRTMHTNNESELMKKHLKKYKDSNL